MNLSELKTTELDLIIEALEYLPNKNQTGEFMMDLLGSMLVGKDEDLKIKMEVEREERRSKAEQEKNKLREEVKILQAKILMIKQNNK